MELGKPLRDLVIGWEFSAKLQISTALEALLHHGEIFRGSRLEAPKYGEWLDGYSSDGAWIPATASWYELVLQSGGDLDAARKLDEFGRQTTHASDIGYVRAEEYLPFLIEFRKIVEANAPTKVQLIEIGALATASDSFALISDRLSTLPIARVRRLVQDFSHPIEVVKAELRAGLFEIGIAT